MVISLTGGEYNGFEGTNATNLQNVIYKLNILIVFKCLEMIKVYFDWNVLSQMKNGKHSELKILIQDNEKLLIPFSTSHINDISSSFKNTPEQKNTLILI